MKKLLLLLLPFFLLNCEKDNPKVIFKTELGNFEVEVFENKAPETSANFLKYVDSSYYKNSEFYRTVRMNNQPADSIKISVIQGGIYDQDDIFDSVEHETTKQTGIKHLDGVISMARLEPGTATDDFFFCIGAQPELDFGGERNPDGQGFAAFGKIINGRDILDKIHSSPAEGQMINPRVKIFNIERVKK